MKKSFQLSILFALIFCCLSDVNAFVVDVESRTEASKLNDSSLTFDKNTFSKKQLRKSKKQAEKLKRLKKRWIKFQQNWELRSMRKSIKKEKKRRRFFGGITDDNRFRVGLILIVASLLVGILVKVPLFGGLFGIIAGLAGLVGLILIFLAMLDYF